jgi:hypothetical protein
MTQVPWPRMTLYGTAKDRWVHPVTAPPSLCTNTWFKVRNFTSCNPGDVQNTLNTGQHRTLSEYSYSPFTSQLRMIQYYKALNNCTRGLLLSQTLCIAAPTTKSRILCILLLRIFVYTHSARYTLTVQGIFAQIKRRAEFEHKERQWPFIMSLKTKAVEPASSAARYDESPVCAICWY